jgi:hypothetical protein
MRVLALVLVSFLLGGAPLPAAGPSGLELDGGLVLLGSTDPQSAPSPIMPALGAVFPLRSLGPLTLESSLLLFGTYYQYVAANDRASPAEPEHRGFWMQCILGDARLRYDWRLSDKIRAGADAGLALLLRVPIPLSSEAGQDFGATLGYVYGAARFLYPETGLFARFSVLENLELKLSLRAAWPVYLLWDGEQLPFPEGMLLSGILGFVIKTRT